MRKTHWLLGAAALCVQCTGATQSSSPQEPPGAEPSDKTNAEAADESPGAAASESSEAPPSAETKPAKKACAELNISRQRAYRLLDGVSVKDLMARSEDKERAGRLTA